MTRYGFRELLENRVARGISEEKKIAMMAETCYLPVVPHNCGGPVLHCASTHLAANLTNLNILETVRRHYLEDYKRILTAELALMDGLAPLPTGPRLGVELDPKLLMQPEVSVDRTPNALS